MANKVTVESLRQMGFVGYQRNTKTGNVLEANYPLEDIAWMQENQPDRILLRNDDIGGKVFGYIVNNKAAPFENIFNYIERPMTEQELAEADKRLAKLGIVINRNNTNNLQQKINDADKIKSLGNKQDNYVVPNKDRE